MASTVPRTRGSVAGRKPTSGISSRLASSRFVPYACTKEPSSGSNPWRQTWAWTSSRRARQWSTGPCPLVAGEPVHRVLEQPPLPAQPVQDTGLRWPAGQGAQQPAAPGPGLVTVAGAEQGQQREGGVAQPAVAVIPVAVAAQPHR